MPTLTRSLSCDDHARRAPPTPPCRSGSFSYPASRTHMHTHMHDHRGRPRCPGGDGEWAALSRRLSCCFRLCSEISERHPAAACLARCDVVALAEQLRPRHAWLRAAYTRTPLLSGEGFNVQLLCWAPGCSSPVHAHRDADTGTPSNCFMLILEGSLTETLFESTSLLNSKTVNASSGKSRVLSAGNTAYINDCIGYHKVGNPTSSRAVSLHIYAPGWQNAPLFDESNSTCQAEDVGIDATGFQDDVDAGGAPFDVAWGDF